MSKQSEKDFVTAEAEYQHSVKVLHVFDYVCGLLGPLIVGILCWTWIITAWRDNSRR